MILRPQTNYQDIKA